MPKMRSNNNVGRQLTELRRSNAAGFHDKQPSRADVNRREIIMSILDGEYPESRIEADWQEPTDADILALQEEEAQYPRVDEDEDLAAVLYCNTGYEDENDPHLDDEE